MTFQQWEVDIPQAAFCNEMVLNALLGISALNLLSLNPNDLTLALASRRFVDKAVTLHRTALHPLDTQNSEALVIAGVLIAHCSWLLTSAGASQEPYQIDLNTYRLCMSIAALVDKAAPWLLTAVDVKDDVLNPPVLYPRFLRSAANDVDALLLALDDAELSSKEIAACQKAAHQILETCSHIASTPHGNRKWIFT